MFNIAPLLRIVPVSYTLWPSQTTLAMSLCFAQTRLVTFRARYNNSLTGVCDFVKLTAKKYSK